MRIAGLILSLMMLVSPISLAERETICEAVSETDCDYDEAVSEIDCDYDEVEELLVIDEEPVSACDTEEEIIDYKDTKFGASEQAMILIENEGEYEICICELYSTTFGYQYTLNIWTESTNEWCKHGVDAKQRGELDLIIEQHDGCDCELWYITLENGYDERSGGEYDFALYLYCNGEWNTFYGILA